eukprot:scaffold1878_cov104-Cylindrotheca_fusiformis.AAC.5
MKDLNELENTLSLIAVPCRHVRIPQRCQQYCYDRIFSLQRFDFNRTSSEECLFNIDLSGCQSLVSLAGLIMPTFYHNVRSEQSLAAWWTTKPTSNAN